MPTLGSVTIKRVYVAVLCTSYEYYHLLMESLFKTVFVNSWFDLTTRYTGRLVTIINFFKYITLVVSNSNYSSI